MIDANDANATKPQLLERILASKAAWRAAAEAIPDAAMTRPVLAGGWSGKDLLAHVAYFERWTAAHLQAATEGRDPTSMELYGQDLAPDGSPDDPGGWDLDRENAAIHARYRDVPLAEVLAFADHAHDALVAALEAAPEADLARPGAQAWANGQSLLEFIPGQSWRHVEEHIDALRSLAGKDVV